MSDMTLLANQYAVSAEFLQLVNTALLRLKKAKFGTRSSGRITESDLRESRDELARLVEAVLARLKKQSAGPMMVPEELIERFQVEYGSQLSWRLPDLQEAVRSLRSAEEMSERVLRTLDDLCQVADATTSASFRRLWRR
ncbi:MAG: hypothetical protein GY856_47675 [bacterium]|nr:hypothetical protein [bacterium]